MRLKEFHLKNVFNIKRADIVLPKDPGLIMVGGPNGAGKSSLFESLNYALFSKTMKTSRGVLRDGRRFGSIDLMFDDAEVELVLGADDKLIVHADGIDIADKISLMRKWMLKYVGFSFVSWVNSFCYGTVQHVRFVNSRPQERKAILGDVLDFATVAKWRDRAKEALSESDTMATRLEGKIELLRAQSLLGEVVGQPEVDKLTKSSQSCDKKIMCIRQEMAVIKAKLGMIDEERRGLGNGVFDDSAIEAYKKKLKRYKLVLSKERCYACDTEVRGENKARLEKDFNWHLRKLKREEQELADKQFHYQEAMSVVDDRAIRLTGKWDDSRDNLASLERHAKILHRKLESVKRSLWESQKAQKAKARLRKLVAKYKRVRAGCKQYADLIEAFGEYGFKVYLLRKFVPLLEARLNYFLEYTTGGEFSTTIDPATLRIAIRKGKREGEWESFSDGEKKLVAILFNCAMIEILHWRSDVNFAINDETLSLLDRHRISSVMRLMEAFAQTNDLRIFIISNQGWIFRKYSQYPVIMVNSKNGVGTARLR